MPNPNITYEFDPTGQNPLNKVINEQQPITSVNFQDYHYIVPKWAPFFAAGLTLAFNNPDGSSRTLVEGVDYYLGYQFIQASKACAKPLYGSIQFLDTDLAGVIRISYQTVGGNWTLSTSQIAELLANKMYNPRNTSWEMVVARPIDFPVIDHEWNLVDMVGAKEMVASIDNVRAAISASTGGGLQEHVSNKSNPHETTAAQIGLGNVQNFPIATTPQAQAGVNTTTYMTPATTAAAILALGSSNLQAHLNDQNNPHGTTKAQVGLGNVPNYAMATGTEALAGISTTTFMSPALTAQVVAVVTAALNAHTANTMNPHATTKDQMQLFNVANFPPATSQQAQDGTDNASYMTPLRVKQAISFLANVDLQQHLSDFMNPHAVNKSQVGLGSVDNFATATQAEATNNTVATKFMTPQRVSQAISFYVGNDFLNHLNAANPHGVTAAQVGLENVPNFMMATNAEATAGTAIDRFMSPARTTDAITFQVGTAFADHVALSNPHNTTKTDVGLGQVQNYAIASDPEAAAGLSSTVYLTPRGGSLLLNANLGGHLSDTNNPHATTKEQVGLGNVQNFDIASAAEANAGTSNVKYVTPQTATLIAQNNVNAHGTRQDNPHAVTAIQVGLGNVQNFPIASLLQAQTGTDSATYMTPARVKDAILSQVPALVNVHANRTDNPHSVTAAQVGSYTTAQTDQLLLAKLGVNDTATNSGKLGGYSVTDLQNLLTQSSVNGGFLDSKPADAANTTGYTWARLGTVGPITNSANGIPNATPDLIWLISGGESPTALKSPSYRLSLSIRDIPANGYVNYSLTPESPEPDTGAPEFGFTYDSATNIATVYARMGTSNNPLSIVQLNKGGGGVSIVHLGYQNPPTPTMMTKSSSNQALQAQVNTLQTQLALLQGQLNTLTTDVATGLQALTAAINNL